MIKVRLNSNPLDPYQRVSNLLARVFREFSEKKKLSTVLEVICGPDDKPVRFQLRALPPKVLKGSSRPQRRPRMTNSNRST